MTRHSDLKTINCTSCGAGLDVLGGGRVKIHVCSYCGSELDAQEDYAVLKKNSALKRPDSPFRIGMSGRIDGVMFTIIGTLGHQERYAGQLWTWTDHQLFSPTHGYAFLTVEDGHFIFTRRDRSPTQPAWISSHTVENSETRPKAWARGETFTYYDSGTSLVTFLEGEFNWHPKIGERTEAVTLLGADAQLTYSRSGAEEEVYRSIYLPFDDTCAAFGITSNRGQRPQGVHPLMPYTLGKNENFFRRASMAFFALCFLLTVQLTASREGALISQDRVAVETLPMEIPLEITAPNRLARVKVSSDVDNSWAYVGLFLTDPEDMPVFEAGRTMERYSGRDAEGGWREGSGRASLQFTPRSAGTYTLEVTLEEAEVWQREGRPLSSVTVETYQGGVAEWWMMLATLGFGAFALFQFARPILHSHRRWWGSDWVEEDDD